MNKPHSCHADRTDRRLLLPTLACALLTLATPAAANDPSPVLDVYGSEVRAVIVAIPPARAGVPSPRSDWSAAFDKRLRAAIAFHGSLAPLQQEAMLNDHSPFGTFRAEVWRAAGAEMLLSTQLSRDGQSGAASADVHLYDVGAGESVLSRRFRLKSGTAASLADAVASAVVELLLGIQAPFAEPLAFQYRQPGQKWRELYTTDWDGSDVRQRTNNQKLVLHPSYLPNSNQLVAIGYRDRTPALRFFDLDKSTERVLLKTDTTIHGPTAAANGRFVVFAWERGRNTDLYRIDLSTGKWERLTTSTAADLSPTVSPDGSKIAFISDRRGNPYIYMLDVASGRTEPLVLEGNYLGEPDWSPDGKRLAFIRRDRGTGFSVWTYDLASGKTVQVTPDLGDSLESPAWAPDSRTLIYSRLEGKSYDIWKVDRLLKNPTRLTNLPGDARMPTWQPRHDAN